MKHLEFEQLVKRFEDFESQTDEEREVSEHLRACTECAAQLKKLESFFAYVNADKKAKVSQADTAKLLNIFKPKKEVSAASRGGSSKIKRLFASLVFDDWQMVVQERLAFSDSRHLLYRAGQFEIDLRLHFAGGSCQASGQVFPDCTSPAAPAASAELFSAETSAKVFLNDCGEFVFPAVKEGIYNFRLNSGETTIEIENLSLVN